MTQPLSVSGQLRATGAKQQDVAAKIEAAKSVTDGSAGDVFKTHGLVCTATSTALKSAELARRSAAEKMQLISTDLGLKLNTAANDYTGTDQQEAGKLGKEMPPR
jgi:hypothetical protein